VDHKYDGRQTDRMLDRLDARQKKTKKLACKRNIIITNGCFVCKLDSYPVS